MSNFSRRAVLGLGAALPFLATSLKAAGHATVHEVSIEGFSFVPAMPEVKTGDTIIFTNLDGAPHTVTADSGAFESGRMKRNDTYELVVEDAGEQGYFCSFHRSMKGTIVAS